MESLEMERHCRHSNSVFVPACRDAVLLQERVLANLLTAETLYCSTAGTKPRPGLAGAERRRLVTEWMLEVCQVHRSSHHVFLAAVCYLDTALASLQDNTRPPPDLQCLAAACLCLASKLLDPQPMSLSRFVLSPLSELQRTELLVLGLVGWELAAPTSLDFLPLVAASWPAAAAPAAASCRGRAETFLVLAATEAQYSHLRPSTLAVLALLASLQLEPCSSLVAPLARLVRLRPGELSSLNNTFASSVRQWLAVAGGGNIT